MKKLLFLLLIFSACTKDKDNPGTSTSGSISYKVKQLQGNLVQKTRYLLNAQKGINNIFITAIVTDSLQQKNYHYDSTNNDLGIFMFTIKSGGSQSMLFYKGDYFDVNISSYKNGRISGSFSAKITPLSLDYNLRGTILITDGKLNNVPVTY